MQLVTGCHNIAGRSRTCSEYKDDFLLALNAFGCLLQCAQRLRLLPTLAQRARLLRLPIASAPPCRRRLSVASIVCASLSKTTFPWCGFDRGLGPLGRRAGGCCLARQLVDDLRAALVLRQNYTSCSRAEACTPPSDRCVPPEIVRSRATDARVDCVIIRPIAATVRFIFMRRGSVGFFNGIASRLRIGLTTFFFRVATRRSRRHGKSHALRARHDCFFQPTRVFKSREIEAFLGEVHDQRAIASPSRASLQKMAAQSIGADNVEHEDRDIGQAR